MLGRPLAFHDVEDAERLCAFVLYRSGLELSWHDSEDLLAYLVVECWRLSERYEPGGTVTFSTFATTTLRKRVIDWKRTRYRTRWQFDGHVYERKQPTLVSIDDDPERTGLGKLVGQGGLDSGGDRFTPRLRALHARGCPPGREVKAVG